MTEVDAMDGYEWWRMMQLSGADLNDMAVVVPDAWHDRFTRELLEMQATISGERETEHAAEEARPTNDDPVLAELEMLLGCVAMRDDARDVIVMTFRRGSYYVQAFSEPCGLSEMGAQDKATIAAGLLRDVAEAFDSVGQCQWMRSMTSPLNGPER